MLIFLAVTISVGNAFLIFIVRTEKKLRWVLFLIIGIESLQFNFVILLLQVSNYSISLKKMFIEYLMMPSIRCLGEC